MISKELAKQLKDAGFPQRYHWKSPGVLDHYASEFPDDPIEIPTLSDLIEACGDNLHCLVHITHGGIDSDKKFWSAGYNAMAKDWCNGPTPEEAVANLWLALRESQKCHCDGRIEKNFNFVHRSDCRLDKESP